MHPIELGNIVLILVGITLVGVGLVVLYRTVTGLLRKKELGQTKLGFYYASELLNIVIGIVFLIAGVLFVINNLKGNPITNAAASLSPALHLESQT